MTQSGENLLGVAAGVVTVLSLSSRRFGHRYVECSRFNFSACYRGRKLLKVVRIDFRQVACSRHCDVIDILLSGSAETFGIK